MNLSILRREMAASLVVFLVSLPLSLGIAVASDAKPITGLIAAAIGGIVAGLFGGAPLLVSGPAAGLSVIVADLISRFGFETVTYIVLCAGLLQMLLGVSKLARWATAVAPAVLHGMLAGIGVLIAVAQAHVVLGNSPAHSFWKNLALLPQSIGQVNMQALSLGFGAIFLLLAWPHLPLKRLKLPPALFAVGACTLVAHFGGFVLPRVKIPTSFAWKAPMLHDDVSWVALASAIVAMALVASTESLLSAVAVDKMHSGPRANLDRELFGQGLANLISGFCGGLPITGVILRSTVNIEAGAKTRFPAVLCGLYIVVATYYGAAVLNAVPLAALGGLLCVIGCRLVSFKEMRTLHRHGESVVYGATLAGVVGINLLAGIGIGLSVAMLKLVWQLGRARINVEHHDARRTEVRISGAVTFMFVPQILATLQALPPGKQIDVEVSALLVDHAAREALHDWRNGYSAQGPGGEATLNLQLGARKDGEPPQVAI